jgi:DNA-directed RNA polymerase subunit E'/Rpb7
MEPYFKENFFTESMVISPKYLNFHLCDHLGSQLANKYSKTYLNKGYIFNIKVTKILDNKITLSGQIVVNVEFRADIYVPKIGHTFQGELKKGLANKFQWVEIGPLTIFLNKVGTQAIDDIFVTIQITSIKSDNTICFGKLI